MRATEMLVGSKQSGIAQLVDGARVAGAGGRSELSGERREVGLRPRTAAAH